jgi:Cu(I)/Ag(I) efflux system membrane fusion protein
VIPVPERAVADIREGQILAVSVSAIKKTFNGKIVRFSDEIDTGTRTMHTEVNVPNPTFELVPGMYASVQIPLHGVNNALTVPVQAVQAGGNGQGAVLVVNASNRIEKRSVALGLETATDAEILSGLKEGEMVVFGQQNQFRPDQLVSPQIVKPVGME